MTEYLSFLIMIGILVGGYQRSRKIGFGRIVSFGNASMTPVYIGKWIATHMTEEKDYLT